MKIGKLADLQQTDALRAAQAAGTQAAGSSGDGNKVASTEAAASVRLSDASRRLATEAAAGSGAPMRADKVAAVRQALADGRFHVDAAAVADKMISEAAELLETLSQLR